MTTTKQGLIERATLTDEEKQDIAVAAEPQEDDSYWAYEDAFIKAATAKALYAVVDWIPTQASEEGNLDKHQAILWLDWELVKVLKAAGIERP